jgi:septal ring-binding cell division protein DamX
MASPISSLLGAPANNPTPNSTAPGAAPDEQMFLKLLVSQIQNQDPLNPADSTQFVAQLAQFSELEQLIAMRGDMDKIAGTPPTASDPAANNPSSATTGSSPSTDPNSTSPSSSANGPANTQS